MSGVTRQTKVIIPPPALLCHQSITNLVSLDTTVRLAVLSQTIMLLGLVVTARVVRVVVVVVVVVVLVARTSAGLSALLASLDRVYLAVGKLALGGATRLVVVVVYK